MTKFFRKLLPVDWGQPEPMLPNRDAFLQINKRPVLYQEISTRTLQESLDELQQYLHDKGYLSTMSGKFDAETDRAVRAFQRKHNLLADGVVGILTWVCLYYPTLSRHSNRQASPDIKAAIKTLQMILREEGFSIKDASDSFGRDTEKAVKVFQSRYGLKGDGVVSAVCWAVLLGMRRRVNGGFLQEIYPLVPQSLFLCDQLLMIVFIVLGMYLNPISTAHIPPRLSNAVATAYALTCIVPMLLDRIPWRSFDRSKLPLLRYAPFVCVGMFWDLIFKALERLIENVVSAS
ncbi:peptidoglycan-binding protein [Oculatella sp. LEGE 06141]|uniref:peptidoglycan-binding domain-containing protein n=1 Tax=Oculatella sp. LEGE 06141 TaxID=1828648 RepID=UPI00187F4E22|nr:peptidoglycan-binding protein [Oculatella sp. LEGE 06141]MBE9178504.1 peptidoglycan-binding protein [Oculatella sp. LEGE 06141]